MKKIGEVAVQNRLQKYFNKHYSKYDTTAEWYMNVANNIWKFDIPSKTVVLSCDEYGKITEY